MRLLIVALCVFVFAGPARAKDVFFIASDGARLHYTQSGPPGAPVIVFVPGWTMPGWIFAPQLSAFGAHYQVVAFDPRGQGDSEITATGYDLERRGQDIAELLARLPGRVVVVGWSLGVLDTLAYIHANGDARLAGLVLIDNSVGENPPPRPLPFHWRAHMDHAAYMRAFVAGMFTTPQPAAYLNRLTQACLEMPQADAAALLRYPVPRSYWKDTLLSTDIPVLYVVRPRLAGQANNLRADRPDTEIMIFHTAGHALFVDQPGQFDAVMRNFLESRVWP